MHCSSSRRVYVFARMNPAADLFTVLMTASFQPSSAQHLVLAQLLRLHFSSGTRKTKTEHHSIRRSGSLCGQLAIRWR
jgi:hypothetical protein